MITTNLLELHAIDGFDMRISILRDFKEIWVISAISNGHKMKFSATKFLYISFFVSLGGPWWFLSIPLWKNKSENDFEKIDFSTLSST